VEAAGKLADALVLLSPGWPEAWRLMTWMGRKRIHETMRYVHVDDGHRRELPANR
jgi:hypothetical protein